MKKIIIQGINIYQDNLNENQSGFLYTAAEEFRKDFPGIVFELTKNDKGRPVLINSEYDISFTHTRSLVLCAIGKGRIGIDAEYIRAVDYDKLARKTFSQRDAGLVTDINSFFRMWTRYEARYKLDNSLLTPEINFYDVPFDKNVMITLAVAGN